MGDQDSARLQGVEERTYDLVDRLGKMEGAVAVMSNDVREVKTTVQYFAGRLWMLVAAIIGAASTPFISALLWHQGR